MVPYDSGGSAIPASKKWSSRFPCYQIDFTAVASGKMVATTKRRIRWWVNDKFRLPVCGVKGKKKDLSESNFIPLSFIYLFNNWIKGVLDSPTAPLSMLAKQE